VTIYKDELQAVYKLLRAKSRWTKHDFAKDKDGLPVDALHPKACKWCLDGAFKRVGADWVNSDQALGVKSTWDFNDSRRRTHKQVLAKLRSAIKRAPVRP
jgi:hypothetical protein